MQTLSELTEFLSAYFKPMSLALMATILVIYGDVLNKHVKRIIAPYHFLIRSVLFVLLCTFGYGALTVYGAPFLLHVIKFLPWTWQGVGFVGAFVLLGILAERRRYI